MPRLDSSKGRCRCKLELPVMAGRARKVRANPPETKARAKTRTRTSTRAMTETRTRNAPTGTMVSSMRNSRDTVHIARSGATNVRIVELDWLSRKMVQWPALKNLNLKQDVKAAQWSDVDSEDVVELVFCSVDQTKGPGRHFACRQWCRRSHLTLRDVQGNPIISSRHPTRQSECGHTRTASKH